MPLRRTLALGTIRALVTVIVVVALYYTLPLSGLHRLSDVWLMLGGGAFFVALAVWEVRSIPRAKFPVLRAVQALALVISLFLVVFAAVYFEMEASNSSSFTSHLTRTDALYFCVTVFSTVGFGDIVARTETARIVVMLQMIGDLVIIGALLRSAAVIAQEARRERTGGSGSPDLGDVAGRRTPQSLVGGDLRSPKSSGVEGRAQ